jgi:hypothetical protein
MSMGWCLHEDERECRCKHALIRANFYEKKGGSEGQVQRLGNSRIIPEKIGRGGFSGDREGFSKAASSSSIVALMVGTETSRKPRTQAASASIADWFGVMPDLPE